MRKLRRNSPRSDVLEGRGPLSEELLAQLNRPGRCRDLTARRVFLSAPLQDGRPEPVRIAHLGVCLGGEGRVRLIFRAGGLPVTLQQLMKIILRAAQRSEAGTRLEETPMRGAQPLIHTRAYWPQSRGAPLLTQFDMSACEMTRPSQAPRPHISLCTGSTQTPEVQRNETKTHLYHFLCDLREVSCPLCASGTSSVKSA